MSMSETEFQAKRLRTAAIVLGIIGAISLVAAWVAVLLGLIGAVSPVAAVATLPIAVWEFSLGVYLTFWGFKASPITAGL